MITFIGMGSRSSGKIRGIQVSDHIPGLSNFLDINTGGFIKNPGFHKINIFVRIEVNRLAMDLPTMRANGIKAGFDLLDRPCADVHNMFKQGHDNPSIDWKKYHNQGLDFFIVNNTLTKNLLSEHVAENQKIYVIPHHSVNFENQKSVFRDEVKNIGYLGTEDQLSSFDKINNYCKSKNINLISCHPKARIDCCNILKDLDIGIVYFENGGYNDFAKRYKPNTKLTNFQSFGIPSVVSEYESFKEFGDEAYLKGNTFDELIASLDTLIKSADERNRLRQEGLAASEKFQIDNHVLNYYGKIIADMG